MLDEINAELDRKGDAMTTDHAVVVLDRITFPPAVALAVNIVLAELAAANQTIREKEAELAASQAREEELRREVQSVIDHIPKECQVISREGGGPENLAGTLALSVARLATRPERYYVHACGYLSNVEICTKHHGTCNRKFKELVAERDKIKAQLTQRAAGTDWLKRAADKEDNCITSVGGLMPCGPVPTDCERALTVLRRYVDYGPEDRVAAINHAALCETCHAELYRQPVREGEYRVKESPMMTGIGPSDNPELSTWLVHSASGWIAKCRTESGARRIADAMNGETWRPMTTHVPPSNTELLLRLPEGPEDAELITIGEWVHINGEGYAFWRLQAGSERSGSMKKPTHWKSLPPPPANERSETR